jgi:hypothetical protein
LPLCYHPRHDAARVHRHHVTRSLGGPRHLYCLLRDYVVNAFAASACPSAVAATAARALSRRRRSRLPLACELLRLDDLRRGHFRGTQTAFLDIFVALFFIQNHDVRKRPDNQPLWLSAASSGTRAALRASRFALRRCRSAFSACFRRSVCRDIRAPVSGIVSRE